MAKLKAKPVAIPLVLDFDGTLQRDDLSKLALAWLWRKAPLRAIWVIVQGVFIGKPAAKLAMEEVAFHHNYMPKLRWNTALIQAAKATKQPILVATGSPERWVAALLYDAKLNWPVLGTTAQSGNFIGKTKAKALIKTYGKHGFDYAGNSKADLAVWQACRHAWIVDRKGKLAKRAAKRAPVKKVFSA
jgi:phosphoserine phosphatase